MLAERAVLPVEVLMKSAPAAIASSEAVLTLSRSGYSPVSRMTFSSLSSQRILDVADHRCGAHRVAGEQGAPGQDEIDLVGAVGERRFGLAR